jgi:hypothetical protein
MSGCTKCGSITLFKGSDGRTIYNGTGAPTLTTANEGDFYIDTAASDIYGPFTLGSWGSGTSLIGATGGTGATGAQGNYGGWSSEWEFDNATGTGTASTQYRFDNASPASATNLYVNDTNIDSTDLSAFLLAFNNGGDFGLVRISKTDDPSVFWMGEVTSVTDSGTEVRFGVTTVLADGTFTDGDNFVISFVANGTSPSKGYSVYTAQMTQTGTNAPTANILGTNDIGAIVWTYTGVGQYFGTLAGAFPEDKFWAVAEMSNSSGSEAHFNRISDDVILLSTRNTSFVFTDAIMARMPIEIRVYD